MSEFYAQDDDLDFWENMGQQDGTAPEAAPAEAVADTVEEVVVQEAPAAEADTAEQETPKQERARNEKGQFVKAEQPEEDRLYAGKYKSIEDLERAAQEAQRKIGEMGNELGQYRQWYEQQQAQQQQPVYAPDQLTEWVQTLSPAQLPGVVQQAYTNGRRDVADAALSELEEYDRTTARQLDRWMIQQDILQQQQAVFRQQEQLRQQQSQAEVQMQQGAQQFERDHPDFNQYAGRMSELAEQYPSMLRILEARDPAATYEVLDFLYTKARGQATDTLTEAQKEIAAANAQDEQAAAQAAAVVTAATNKPVPAGKSAADRIGDEWAAIEQPLKDGWNIG